MGVDNAIPRRSRDIGDNHVLIGKVHVEILGADLIAIGTHHTETHIPEAGHVEVPHEGSVDIPGVDVLELPGISPDLPWVGGVRPHVNATDLRVVGVKKGI